MKILFFIYSWIIGNVRKRFPKCKILQKLNSTSIIKIDKLNNRVEKKVVLYNRYNVVENEVKWLTKLNEFEHTPNIISVKKNCITTTYAGQQVTKKNIPKNWKDQMIKILTKLESINCSHNDIKPSDILVLKNKLMLIDFQWATQINHTIPNSWPSYIGGSFKKKDDVYNDFYSFKASINWVLKN